MWTYWYSLQDHSVAGAGCRSSRELITPHNYVQIASEALKGRVIDVSLADLQKVCSRYYRVWLGLAPKQP
jgi:hypothetical protein